VIELWTLAVAIVNRLADEVSRNMELHHYDRGRMLSIKLAFHDADTDTDILADILARIVAKMSACRSACHSNNFRRSRVSDVSARILARMSVSVSMSVEFQLN